MADLIIIDERDNVAVVLRDVAAGDVLRLPAGGEIGAATGVPEGHKIALVDFNVGEPVVKYAEEIGVAIESIAKGAWVHTHNID